MGHIKKTLSDYANKDTLRLHMPGHKGTLNPLDNTEIPQTDDLNNPSGAYKKPLDLLSDIYGSQKSFFITNGTTLGIQAMVLYAKKTGYKIVSMRNSHMSVVNACLIFEVECVFLESQYDNTTNTYTSSAETIIKYLKSTQEKCAILLTSPDYFGRCVDIAKIKEVASTKNALVFCDQAHGSHFVFSKLLPSAVVGDADIWVNGAHKTLGAYTQGAFVHCGLNVDANMFSGILRALNTSSPSHIIASSLEEALIESQGDAWDKRAKECRILEDRINSLSFIKCANHSWAQSSGYDDKDVTRMVIDAKDAGGGFYLYDRLFKDHNIQLEMADFRYAVAIMTIYDEPSCDQKLYTALKELDVCEQDIDIPNIPDAGKAEISINKAWLSKVIYARLEDAVGKLSASVLGAYPPGTALVLPGEVILKKHIEYFKDIIRLGGHMFGHSDGFIAIVDI